MDIAAGGQMSLYMRYPVTAMMSLVAAFIAIAHAVIGHDLFDFVVGLINRVDPYGLDELVIPLLLIFAGRHIDLGRTRQRQEREIQAQRLHILRATMRTVQDIVNNFLNNLQLFRLEAEAGAVSAESLHAFDELVQATSTKLTALGDLDSTPERVHATGIGIDFGER
jgi:hypothetical protein